MKRFILCAVLCGLVSNGMQAAAYEREILGGVVGVFGTLIATKGIYPYLSGKWERDKQDRLLKEFKQKKQLMDERAQRALAKLERHYAGLLTDRITKEQFLMHIRREYGNQDCKFVLFDRDLNRMITDLEGIDLSIAIVWRDKVANNLKLLHILRRATNELLEDELVRDRERERSLHERDARLQADLDSKRQLQHLTREVMAVVKAQEGNRDYLNAKFDGLAKDIRDHRTAAHNDFEGLRQNMQNQEVRNLLQQLVQQQAQVRQPMPSAPSAPPAYADAVR